MITKSILLFSLCLGIILFVLLLKGKGRTRLIVLILSAFVLIGTLSFCVKNYVITFPSPEAAFLSYQSNRNLSPEVILGNETALVFAPASGKLRTLIVEKEGYEWIIGNSLSDSITGCYLANGRFATLYHRSGTHDYFVIISIASDEEHIVTDNAGSSFREIVSFNGVKNYVSYFYWAIDDGIDGYTVSIDNEVYHVNEEINVKGGS